MYFIGAVKTSYGADGSIEKTLSLPGNHEISIGQGKNGGFGYGYTTDEHGKIGGLSAAPSIMEHLYGVSERGHYGGGGGGGGGHG